MRMFCLVVVLLLSAGCPGEFPVARGDQGAGDDLRGSIDGRADSVAGVKDGSTAAADKGQQAQDTKTSHVDTTSRPADLTVPDLWTYDGSIGKPCQGWQDCTSPYICTTNTHTGHSYCTLPCDPCADNPCPTGTGCQPAGQGYFICALGYPNADC